MPTHPVVWVPYWVAAPLLSALVMQLSFPLGSNGTRDRS